MNRFIHENNQLFISLKLESKKTWQTARWRSGNKILQIFFFSKTVLGKEVTRSTRGDQSSLHLLRHITLYQIFPRAFRAGTLVKAEIFGQAHY